jgi:thymidylate kinase
MNKVFFITGVNGVGKSSLVTLLKETLPKEQFTVYDFDKRGVPDNADRTWRATETLYWANKAKENLETGLSTIVCGFMKFPEIFGAAENANLKPEICLLDVNAENIEKRLRSRYQTPESVQELIRTTGKSTEKFVTDNIWVSEQFRSQAKTAMVESVDTSNKTLDEVLVKILHWIHST